MPATHTWEIAPSANIKYIAASILHHKHWWIAIDHQTSKVLFALMMSPISLVWCSFLSFLRKVFWEYFCRICLQRVRYGRTSRNVLGIIWEIPRQDGTAVYAAMKTSSLYSCTFPPTPLWYSFKLKRPEFYHNCLLDIFFLKSDVENTPNFVSEIILTWINEWVHE